MTGVVKGNMFVIPGGSSGCMSVGNQNIWPWLFVILYPWGSVLGLFVIPSVSDKKIEQPWVIKKVLGLCRLHFNVKKR